MEKSSLSEQPWKLAWPGFMFSSWGPLALTFDLSAPPNPERGIWSLKVCVGITSWESEKERFGRERAQTKRVLCCPSRQSFSWDWVSVSGTPERPHFNCLGYWNTSNETLSWFVLVCNTKFILGPTRFLSRNYSDGIRLRTVCLLSKDDWHGIIAFWVKHRDSSCTHGKSITLSIPWVEQDALEH